MQLINQIFATYPTLSSLYIGVAVAYWFFNMFYLHHYIQMSGLDYASGLYHNMTAEQQRIEWNKHKLKKWLAGIFMLTLLSTVWPIGILILIFRKKA